MSKTSAAKEGPTETVSRLIEISKLDPLYRDLYLQRAREVMKSVMPQSSYTAIKESAASLGFVERQLRVAVEHGDWERSRELTERVRAIKASASSSGEAFRLAEALYDDVADIPIDPFAPGLHTFSQGSAQSLQDARRRAIAVLGALERSDTAKKDFYARRAGDFQNLKMRVSAEQSAAKETGASAADLRQEALTALDSGNLSQLDDLVKKLMESSSAAKEEKSDSPNVKLGETSELGEDLDYSFSDKTLEAARRLGLAPARTESRRQFAYLMAYNWQPSFLQSESKNWAKEQLAHITSESGDKLREAVEFYLLNPFINSGGTRYQVCLVAEDLLVEDFDEADSNEPFPKTELLSALGLETRRGLSRIDIENALNLHGPRIVAEELGLNPEEFRLVAIPADVYTSLGRARGWGQKEGWTHFDGYVVREGGKLRALAGGDIRFGGTEDVLSLDRAYGSEKIITRFAVVQRKRMRSWQKA